MISTLETPVVARPEPATPDGPAFRALTTSQIDAFESVLARLSAEDLRRVETALAPAAAAAGRVAHGGLFGAPAEAVPALLGPDAGDEVRRGLIAAWALGLPARVAALDLPPSMLALYPDWTDRLGAWLRDGQGAYDADHWAKDVRFALALSVPGAQSQVIDLGSRLARGEILRHALSGRGVDVLWRFLASGGAGPWLEVHTEARHLADFNEDGWNSVWARAADLVRRRPQLLGMIGASWFYDPPLEQISPRLAHLRLNPTRNGAWMIHQGPHPIHTERASTASPTRKAMIDSGEYTARSWIVVWPRESLLRWADGRAGAA